MPSQWYETFFHGVALEAWCKLVTPEQTRAEADFLQKALALRTGARVLDVPCGNGRLSIELAARGYRGLGVDISDEWIRDARDSGADWEWRRGDMRDLPDEPAFDGAFCWGNSFGYLDHEGTRAFVAALSASLNPGARFALEAGAAAECLLPALQTRQWFRIDDLLLLIERRYRAAESTLEIDYTFVRGGERETRPALQRVYTAAEIRRLLAEAGLKTQTTYGSIQGEPFALGSPRLIVVAEKNITY